MIDSQPATFTTDVLVRLKRDHEQWVHDTLEVSVTSPAGPALLRLTHARTGKEILDAVIGYHALQFDYCEPRNADEEDAIAELSEELHDCDNAYELGGTERVRLASRLSTLLRRLGDQGMLVWWGHVTRQLRTSTAPMPFRLTVVQIRRMSQDQELIADHLREIRDALKRADPR